jgi:hypothetical protein
MTTRPARSYSEAMVQGMAQPDPAQAQGWPRFGRDIMDRAHALYIIANCLEALSLGSWTHTLVRWLGQYDGLEEHLPQDHDPLLSVRDMLSRHLTSGQRPEIGRIAQELCAMPWLYYRAAWLNTAQQLRRDWRPLEQPWLEFAKAEEGEDHMHFWQASDPYPSADELRRHLLAGYVRNNGLR